MLDDKEFVEFIEVQNNVELSLPFEFFAVLWGRMNKTHDHNHGIERSWLWSKSIGHADAYENEKERERK